MIDAVLEIPRSALEQAISGRVGYARESRTEGARVVRDVRPRIRSALGTCWTRGNTGPCFSSNQIWLGHHGYPCAPLATLDGAPLCTGVAGGGWTAHRDSCLRGAVLDLPLLNSRKFKVKVLHSSTAE